MFIEDVQASGCSLGGESCFSSPGSLFLVTVRYNEYEVILSVTHIICCCLLLFP